MEIAINCKKKKRHERPTIEDIISKLDETETVKIDTQLSIKKGYFEESRFLSSGILGRPCQC
uniref:Serine-threonine/tyrosine-protein kinase catalytic domain-containing protein n=1 Tax=Setaria italica TaxID=4555 RepID=K3ZKW2_SETIT